MRQVIRTIDAHVGGQPLRLVVEGAPALIGNTKAHKRAALKRVGDRLRRLVVLEPRGHGDMCAALLTEPVSPGAHAGVLFMDGEGFPALSGHAIIAVATIALERGLIVTSGDTLTFDTVAGAVHAQARLQVHGDRRRVDAVAFTSVPSFVQHPGHPVRAGGRELRVDIAYGGLFYAIVDTEATGVPIDAARLPDLRRLAVEISAVLNAAGAAGHPVERALSGVAGVIFTGPPNDPEAHLRNVTVSAAGAVDRSPCATGTSAVMAVLDAMGLLPEQGAFVTRIEGTAWMTGEQLFQVDDDDPLRDGFRL